MSESKDEQEHEHEHGEDVIENPDPHFEPIISLPPVQTKTLEEDEDELVKLRAKLFRYETTSEPREWKERGVGDVKILKHKQLGTCRILMRRDKTLKICANHYVLPQLELKEHCGSDRAWVWSTPADFADEEQKPELLAIRFANAENALKFREAFERAKKMMTERLIDVGSEDKKSAPEKDKETVESVPPTAADDTADKDSAEADKVTQQLEKLSVATSSDKTSEATSSGDAAPTKAS